LGLSQGALAHVTSRRGKLLVSVRADESLRPGHAFLPMHWGSAFISGSGVNALANPARDPSSGQPELKHAAIHVSPAGLAGQAIGWIGGPSGGLSWGLASWLEDQHFAYQVLVPVAVGVRSRQESPGFGGVRLRLAAASATAAGILAELCQELGLA